MQDARRRLSRLYSQQAALAKASALVQDRAADQEMAAADSRESLVGCVGVWVCGCCCAPVVLCWRILQRRQRVRRTHKRTNAHLHTGISADVPDKNRLKDA